jgi:uncharacterized short protein YbdD (DUF466 family)
MINFGLRHSDEIFHDMESELKKFAATFISLMDYEKYLRNMDCEQLKAHQSDQARVPAENFEKKKVYEKICKEKGCVSSADDSLAIAFAIQYITKIADELDKNGFIEVANILDEMLQKFATLHDCKDCEQ